MIPFSRLTNRENRKLDSVLQTHSSDELINTLYFAIDVYYNRKEDWTTLIRHAMNTDVSWEKSAVTYGLLYDELLKY